MTAEAPAGPWGQEETLGMIRRSGCGFADKGIRRTVGAMSTALTASVEVLVENDCATG